MHGTRYTVHGAWYTVHGTQYIVNGIGYAAHSSCSCQSRLLSPTVFTHLMSLNLNHVMDVISGRLNVIFRCDIVELSRSLGMLAAAVFPSLVNFRV